MENPNPDPVDRTGWPPGPWDNEPDRIEWIDEATGQPCLMRRNGWGAWCGYTAVNPGHPLHGVDYSELWERHDPQLDVHGGITYTAFCHGEICHIPQPGEPDDVFWWGFDCAHGFDLAPGLVAKGYALGGREAYRDVAYVREQVTSLARQLAELA
jgi:hypothetical protein